MEIAFVYWERVVTVALVGFAAFACWVGATPAPRGETQRRRVVTSTLLFVGALIARLLVPRVPSNFYSDLPSAFPSFRYDTDYRNPFYDLLAQQTVLADAPIWANIVLGSLVCSLLFLALDGIRQVPALLVGIAVAILPLYVRMSAMDAPHVYGLFLFAVGAVFFRRALDSGSPVDFAAFACAAYLVGATRRELAVGPLMYAGIGLLDGLGGVRSRRWQVATIVLVVAVVCGGLLTHIAVYGHSNADLAVTLSGLVNHFGSVCSILPMLVIYHPLAVSFGIVCFVVAAVRERRAVPILAYAGGLYVLTLPYAFSPGFSGIIGPFDAGASLRYALIWMMLPVVVSAYGWRLVLRSEFVRRSSVGLRVAGLVVLWITALPLYVVMDDYEMEELFLRNFLRHSSGTETVIAGWQKWAGTDLAMSISIPYYTLGGRGHPFEGFPYDTDWLRLLASRDEDTLVFVNLLGIEALDHGDTTDTEQLSDKAYRGFRELRCLVRNNSEKFFGLDDATDFPLNRWPRAVIANYFGQTRLARDIGFTKVPELAVYRVAAHTDASSWIGCVDGD